MEETGPTGLTSNPLFDPYGVSAASAINFNPHTFTKKPQMKNKKLQTPDSLLQTLTKTQTQPQSQAQSHEQACQTSNANITDPVTPMTAYNESPDIREHSATIQSDKRQELYLL